MGTRVATVHFADKNLAGVPQLLEDLKLLAEDTESADIVFVVGRDEVPVYAHKVILKARYDYIFACKIKCIPLHEREVVA